MKIVSILILALALVALASICVAFAPTSEDVAWKTAVINVSTLMKSDVDKVNNGPPPSGRYGNQLARDAKDALNKSKAYNVSNELQNAKEYYEKSLVSFKNGGYRFSTGCVIRNPSVKTEGLAEINKGSEYMDKAIQELKTVAG